MNLLLLLSALLSALSGIAGGVRAPAQQQAVVCPQATAAATPAARTTASWPVAAIAFDVAVSTVPLATAWRLPAVAPLWTSRRRE